MKLISKLTWGCTRTGNVPTVPRDLPAHSCSSPDLYLQSRSCVREGRALQVFFQNLYPVKFTFVTSESDDPKSI